MPTGRTVADTSEAASQRRRQSEAELAYTQLSITTATQRTTWQSHVFELSVAWDSANATESRLTTVAAEDGTLLVSRLTQAARLAATTAQPPTRDAAPSATPSVTTMVTKRQTYCPRTFAGCERVALAHSDATRRFRLTTEAEADGLLDESRQSSAHAATTSDTATATRRTASTH